MRRLLPFIRESVASMGWSDGLLYVFARSIEKVTAGRCKVVKYYFVAQPVTPEPVAMAAKPSRTRIYRVSPGDGIIHQFPRPPKIIAKRFADGAICYVAERAERFVGFVWIQQNSYCEDEVRCRYVLQPATRLVWDFDAYVTPKFRMSRAFAQLWEAANQYFRDQGYRWTISRISAFNTHSLASHRRLGAVHIDTGLFVVIGTFQLSVFSCAPYIHIAWGPSKVPELVFRQPFEHI